MSVLESVTVSPTSISAGNKITATTIPCTGTFTLQWYRSDGATETAISGAINSYYIATASDVGYYLKCVATGTDDYADSTQSDITSDVVGKGTIRYVTASGFCGDYDGTAHSPTITGTIANDTVLYSSDGKSTWSSNVPSMTSSGNYTIYMIVKRNGYNDLELSAEIIINKKQLTVSGTSIADKVYDRTTSATITLGTVTGIVSGDNVVVTPSAIFPRADVGSYVIKTTYALSGIDADNYIAPVNDKIDADITGADVTSVSLSTNSPKMGERIETSVLPSDATCSFQWSRSSDGTTWSDISGATNYYYDVGASDFGHYLKVTITGTGNWVGTTSGGGPNPTGNNPSGTTESAASAGTLTATSTSEGIKLTWSEISEEVIVKRKTKTSGVWGEYSSLATGVTGSEYLDATSISGVDYKYKLVVNDNDVSTEAAAWFIEQIDYSVVVQNATSTPGNTPVILARITNAVNDESISESSVQSVTFTIYSVKREMMGAVRRLSPLSTSFTDVSVDLTTTRILTPNFVKDNRWTTDDVGYNFIHRPGAISGVLPFENAANYEIRYSITMTNGDIVSVSVPVEIKTTGKKSMTIASI